MIVKNPQIIDLPIITDERGKLTFIETPSHIPFDIKRIYYLYDVPSDCERGAHAHKTLYQLVIAISGAFDVTLNDGNEESSFHLNSPSRGLYVGPMMWRELRNFTHDSVCMVLASEKYDEGDYYRDYTEFLADVDKK